MAIAIIDLGWMEEDPSAPTGNPTADVAYYRKADQWARLIQTADAAWCRRMMATDAEAQERADLVAALDDEQAEIIASIGD